MRSLLVIICLSLTLPSFAQENSPQSPDISGYVTHATSPVDFEVNRFHVLLGPKTHMQVVQNDIVLRSVDNLAPYLGQRMDIYGSTNNKQRTIKANRIDIFPRDHSSISGMGIIDALPQSQVPTGRFIRADGYILLLPNKVTPTFHAPLTSSDAVHTNLWISYQGAPSDDGIIVLDHADIYSNIVKDSEQHRRDKQDYDPSQIDEGDKQSGASKYFRGLDPTKLPAWKDAAMQQRVERVGASLIPAYQHALPDGDPNKISFRFQVIDFDKEHDAISMESGIILVPYQILLHLHTDSQLAAILASDMAEVLEKQTTRMMPASHSMSAAYYTGLAGGFFIPGFGLATTGILSVTAKNMLKNLNEQSGRVSLFLMHDAGYDITEAPEAWRLAATKKGKSEDTTSLPDRSLQIYNYLGILWRNPPPQ